MITWHAKGKATRASLEAREEKSQELYTFTTSAQSAELFDTVTTQIGKL